MSTARGGYVRRRDHPATLPLRLTQYAAGGGCACKVPPGELERVLAGLRRRSGGGRPAGRPGATATTRPWYGSTTQRAVVLHRGLLHPGRRRPATTGGGSRRPTRSPTSTRWAASRWSRSTCWPGRATCCRSSWPPRCCAAGRTCAPRPACHLAGGHSIDDREPKYGLAVTGLADPDRLLRNDAGEPGLPLTLTKPLGLGILNNRHKATGERFPEAVEVMTTLNRDASPGGPGRRARSAPPTSPASGCWATCSSCAAPAASRPCWTPPRCPTSTARGVAGRRLRARRGRRNLDWVRPHLDARWTTTSCCCSRTPRPRAVCWWPASCRVTR